MGVEMNRGQALKAYGAWLAVCVIWSTTYLAIRVAVPSIPPAVMSGVRFTLAGSILLLIMKLRGVAIPPLRRWAHLAVIAVTLIGLGNWLVVWAEKVIPSGPTALMVSTTPFWMAGLEALYGKGESLKRRKAFGLLIGFAGVVVLVFPELSGDWTFEHIKGVLILQFASAAWALGSLYSKYHPSQSDPLASAAVEMLIGGVLLMIIAAVDREYLLVRWDPHGVIAFVYLVVFGAMVAFSCYIYALAHLPSATVSLYSFINPAAAVWLGWLILDEKVGWNTVAATVVIISGIWLVKGDK